MSAHITALARKFFHITPVFRSCLIYFSFYLRFIIARKLDGQKMVGFKIKYNTTIKSTMFKQTRQMLLYFNINYEIINI